MGKRGPGRKSGQAPRAQAMPDTQEILRKMMEESYAEYITARDLLAKEGLYQTAQSGFVTAHPAVKVRDNAMKMYQKLCPLVRGAVGKDNGLEALIAEVCDE